ncbi:hypothetical protein [Neorhizobium sp. JUb45]|uniref:hypothetical protein n=1 Tax=unclassified Neorhizobium TaxID=2629175 RepID=UPI001051C4CA|nr:hypothetical protein [Neorhizobium sp. JUb45]TCR06868.1 hypothetical protein EDF70_101829 [Neorhizobium sp. JUb45]
MRLNLATASAVAIAAAMFHQPVQAADVSEQGAKELQGSLTKMMPEKLVEKGVVAVTPQSDKYQILFDLPKLIGVYDNPLFSLKQITPMTLFATPADGGLWQVEGENDFAMSSVGKDPEGKQSDFSYTIAKVAYDGLFDPAISYFRSGDFSSGAGTITTTAGAEKVDASFSGMEYTLSSVAGAAASTMDFRGSGSIADFKQTIMTPQAPFEFTAESVDIDAGAAGVNAQKLRDLLVFITDKANKQKLDAPEIEELKGHVRAALPFFTSFDEKIDLQNTTVSTEQGDVSAETVSYMMKASGPLAATEVGFGFGAKELTLADGMVPPIYTPFVPTVTDLQFSVPNLNLQAPIDVMLNADYSKEQPLSDAESAAMGLSVFPGGAYTVNIGKSIVTAPSYDLEISGKVTGSLMAPDRVKVDTVILARDFDKTMAAVQQLGQADPQVMQVFLGMTMVKGLAKTDADGRARWEVSVDENRKVTINGNLLPF